MKVYEKTEYPTQADSSDCSVDVLTCDGNGFLNLGFYDYTYNKWSFHTDTLQNGYEKENFVWMYVPEELEIKAGFHNKVKLKTK